MKQYIYQKIKEVCLLIAGGIIGLSALPFTQQVSRDWKYVLLACFILILIGVGVLDYVSALYVGLLRALNKKGKRIAIFAPFELNGNTSSWVSISLDDIFQELIKKEIKHAHIKKIKDIEKFPVIINPYGGLYPEENIANLQSIDKFFNYVRSGGIFVNVADIPFYYAYDENLKRRIDTTPLINGMSMVRGFFDTLLAQKLHVFVFGLQKSPYKGVDRVISLNSNSYNFFPHKITQNGQEYSPYLAIPYGKGYFLFSTIPVNSKKRISDLIKKSLTLFE